MRPKPSTSASSAGRLFPPGISLAEELAIRARCIRELSAAVRPRRLKTRPRSPATVRSGRIISGAGKLTPAERFIFEGDEYIPGVTRVVPDHPCVAEMGGAPFRAAMPGDRDAAVLQALRLPGRSGRARSPRARWQLSSSRQPPRLWRLP